MMERFRGIIAVDEIDETIRVARCGLTRARGLDEPRAPRTVNPTQTDDRPARGDGQPLGFQQDIPGRRAAGARFLGDGAAVVLRVDGGAAGEDTEGRAQNFEKVAQGFDVSDAVGLRIASPMPAQAMDKNIGRRVSGKFSPEFLRIGGIGRDNRVRFARQAAGRFLGGDQPGDPGSIAAKKIRASFAGVTATGDEDARSV